MAAQQARFGFEAGSSQFDLLEERYRALRGVVKQAELRTSDTAAILVLRFVRDSCSCIIEALCSLRGPQRPADQRFQPLDLQKLARMHRQLTGLLAHLKPSPIPVPPEVAASFRRIVTRVWGESELLITVGDRPTFALTEKINDELAAIVDELKALGVEFRGAMPPHILHVRISSADVTQVLLHCIFAHEFGHHYNRLPLPHVTEDWFEDLPVEQRAAAAQVSNAWRLEIVADLFGMFVFGPAYVCACVYYITSLYDMHTATAKHPPFALRLRILIEALNDNFRLPILGDNDESEPELKAAPWLPNTQQALTGWLLKANNSKPFISDEADLPAAIRIAVTKVVSNDAVIMPLRRLAKNLASIRNDAHADPAEYSPLLYEAEVADLVKAINFNVVPVEQHVGGRPKYVTTASILNAAWECFLGSLREFSAHLQSGTPRAKVYRLFNEFLLKTLELSELAKKWEDVAKVAVDTDDEAPIPEAGDVLPTRAGGVLSAIQIRDIATRTGPGTEEWLAVTPVLRWNRQAKPGNSSLDVRLGQRFRVPQRMRIGSLDHISDQHERNIEIFFDDHFVPLGDYFILHPRQFVLGVTLEWLRLPSYLCATVIGRSAWGRDGLIVATATTVHPRYAGVLTLELTNVGEIPIRLYPGLTIAQLVVQAVSGGSSLQGNTAFMLSAYPRSANAAGEDRKIIEQFVRDRADKVQDVVTGD
ncbi:MAG: dCTP deaminase [Thermoanaerobaculia bacterium]